MARRAAAVLLTLLWAALPASAWAEEGGPAPGTPFDISDEPLSGAQLPEVSASAYFVMDADSGQVLLQREPDARHYPASITKIMTAALVLEAGGGRLSEQVSASEAALAAVGEGSTMISLRPGETLTAEQLLYATMLESANDAANVLGEFIDGDLARFVRRMNGKARELGMERTHFENPSGYHADGHYTTARDMAGAMRWALTVPGFLELIGVEEYTLPPTDKTAYPRRFRTDNRLLLEGERHYDGILGGKSGWTPEARYTMIEAARRGGHTLVAVVLDCPTASDRYADCAYLLDYCFSSFQPYELDSAALELPKLQVWSGGQQKGMVQLETAASLLLPEGCTPQDIAVETELPHWYVYGVEFEATATLTDTRTGRRICTVAIVPEAEALRQLLGLPAQKAVWDSRKLPGLVLYAALLALLAFLTSRYAARTRAMRGHSARRSLLRLRERLPAPPEREDEPPDEGNAAPEDEPPRPPPNARRMAGGRAPRR